MKYIQKILIDLITLLMPNFMKQACPTTQFQSLVKFRATKPHNSFGAPLYSQIFLIGDGVYGQ